MTETGEEAYRLTKDAVSTDVVGSLGHKRRSDISRLRATLRLGDHGARRVYPDYSESPRGQLNAVTPKPATHIKYGPAKGSDELLDLRNLIDGPFLGEQRVRQVRRAILKERPGSLSRGSGIQGLFGDGHDDLIGRFSFTIGDDEFDRPLANVVDDHGVLQLEAAVAHHRAQLLAIAIGL